MEGDDETLLAALAFLDEFEEDAGGSRGGATTVETAIPSQVCASLGVNDDRRRRTNERRKLLRRAGVYANPNRVRDERRRELSELREKVEKLQIDLQVLQNEKKQKSRPRVESMVVKQDLGIMSTIWKDIADRQQRRRVQSESENVRLKTAVERQTKVAETLQSLLQKRARQLSDECSCFSNVTCRRHHQVVHVMNLDADVSSFQTLFRQLDAAYREVDVVFAANGLSNMVLTPSDVHIREENDGKCLEVFSNKVLPFDVQDAKEVMWGYFSGVEKHWSNGSLYEKAAKDLGEPYTIVEDFTKEVYSNSSRADIKVKQVVRRYVELDRDVVIWVARVAPIAIKHKMLRGLAYNLRGYAVMKRSPASTADRCISQMQSCTLTFLDQEIDTIYGPETLKALAGFLVVNAAENIPAHQTQIENRLVDRVLRQRMG